MCRAGVKPYSLTHSLTKRWSTVGLFVNTGDELRQKIRTEKRETERLQQDLVDVQMIRDDMYDSDDDESTSSEDSDDGDDLRDILQQLLRENADLEVRCTACWPQQGGGCKPCLLVIMSVWPSHKFSDINVQRVQIQCYTQFLLLLSYLRYDFLNLEDLGYVGQRISKDVVLHFWMSQHAIKRPLHLWSTVSVTGCQRN